MFNLIPTEPFEYHVYADWLEDQGLFPLSVRKGILPLLEDGEGCSNGYFDVKGGDCMDANGKGDGRNYWVCDFVYGDGYGLGEGISLPLRGYDGTWKM